jgi:hypothetical protein
MNSLFFKKGATKVVVLLVPLFFFLFTVPAFAQTDLDDDGIMDDVDDEVIVAENVTLEAGEYFFNNLIIDNGAVLFLMSDEASESIHKGVTINAVNLTIDKTSSINVVGKGYKQGPGASHTRGGAGHGSKGGDRLELGVTYPGGQLMVHRWNR